MKRKETARAVGKRTAVHSVSLAPSSASSASPSSSSSSSSSRLGAVVAKGKAPLRSSSSASSALYRSSALMERRSRNPNDATRSALITARSSSSSSASMGFSSLNQTTTVVSTSDSSIMAALAASSNSATTPAPRAKRVKGVKKSSSEKSKRYREKKKRYIANLDLTVRKLREEVRSLVQKSNEVASLRSRSLLGGSVAKLVSEYNRLFEFGIATESATYSSRRKRALENVMCDSAAALCDYSFNLSTWTELRDKQIAFLRSFMASDICLGDLVGLDAFIDQWICWSDFHSWVHFQMDRMEVSGSTDLPVITVYGSLQVRFSRRTLEMIFPFALAHEQVVQKLIGKMVEYPCRNVYLFAVGPTSGRMLMTRYDVEAQIVQGLLKTLGNLQDVAVLVQDAQLINNHIVGEPAWRMKETEAKNRQRFEQLTKSEDSDDVLGNTSLEAASPTSPVADAVAVSDPVQQPEDKLNLQFILS